MTDPLTGAGVEKATGILIGRTLLTDTSLAVQWCTLEHGIIRTAARGARRPGSPFSGRLDLFLSAEINYIRSARSDLHAVREVRVIDHRPGLQEKYLRLLAAAYFSKLILLVSEADHPIEVLYDLLRRALDWLVSHDPTERVVLFFEMEVTKSLGIHGEYGVSAASAIHQVYHRLPEQREKLLTALRAAPD